MRIPLYVVSFAFRGAAHPSLFCSLSSTCTIMSGSLQVVVSIMSLSFCFFLALFVSVRNSRNL